jgi:penicillin-insensitive murein endopeptidase
MSEQLCRYLSTFAVVLLVLGSMAGLGQTSRCYGTPADGRLVGGVKLPVNGPNFRAYSQLAHTLGRVYLHDRVADLVIATYQALETSRPETMFVYGETGWKHGGSFRPYRTHQNGLSVDFMVPVLDEKGSPTDLPTYALNRYGYGIEFDDGGRFNGLQVDFVALADHLYQLHRLATARGIISHRSGADAKLAISTGQFAILAEPAVGAPRRSLPCGFFVALRARLDFSIAALKWY